MGLLTQAQKDKFWHDGVLVVKDAVSARQLAALRAEFQNWVEESQNHDLRLWRDSGWARKV